MKTCCECKEEKELSKFPSQGGGRLRPYCKICYNLIQKERREANPDRIRESWRKAAKTYQANQDVLDKRRLRKYGLTQEQFDKMYIEQNGCCKICGRDEALVIDHCHDSLVVRGLLCTPCNLLLGNARDNTKTLKKAIEYLHDAR